MCFALLNTRTGLGLVCVRVVAVKSVWEEHFIETFIENLRIVRHNKAGRGSWLLLAFRQHLN